MNLYDGYDKILTKGIGFWDNVGEFSALRGVKTLPFGVY